MSITFLLSAFLLALTAALDITPCTDHPTPLIYIDHVSYPQNPIANSDVKLALHVYNQIPRQLENITVITEVKTAFLTVPLEPVSLCDISSACILEPGDNLIHAILNVPNMPMELTLRSIWKDATNRVLLCIQTTFKPKWSLRSLF
jgi:hypothetical protein